MLSCTTGISTSGGFAQKVVEGAVYEVRTNGKRVPLPLGEDGAKRQVRVTSLANPETLTLPSPKGRGCVFTTPIYSRV